MLTVHELTWSVGPFVQADAANTEAAVTRVFNIASQAAQQLGKKLG